MSEFFMYIAELFAAPFFVRALIVGTLVSLCSSLLGVSLVLKRYSMIGTGLSNVSFGCVTVAVALNIAPLYISIPVVVASSFLLLRISDNSKIKGDSAIAMISSGAISIGVMAVYLTSGVTNDVCGYMFGSVFSLTQSDMVFSAALSVVVIIMFVIFYNRIFAVTFDENFARATGTNAGRYNAVIALLTASTIVVGMKMMGTLLISSLIIFPALTSMRLFKSFKIVVVCSGFLSVFCFFIGMALTVIFEAPEGASVVIAHIAFFLIFSAVSALKKIRKRSIEINE